MRQLSQVGPRCAPKHVPRAFSGRRGGPPPGLSESGLILDPSRGNPRTNRNPSPLYIPGQGNAPQRPGSPMKGPEGTVAPPTYNKFRPPPGFMDTLLKENDAPNLSSQEMLGRLRSNSGYWHQLAKFIPLLNKMGYDSSAIDENTGVTPATQNAWLVGSTVYDSLEDSGKLKPEELSYFDSPGCEELLYPFRFLGVDVRVDAAKYIIKKELDAKECDVLARSLKEWERRVSERNGFSFSSGDCLAFKALRDAFECRQPKQILAKLYEGVSLAQTDTAVARLKEAIAEIENPEASANSRPKATLLVFRLSADELGLRPLPVIGALDEVTSEDIQEAPRARQGGPFGAFNIDNPHNMDCAWAVLPQWKALSLVKTPVALKVLNCAKVPAFVLSCNPKTEEEKQKLVGPGLLVVEASVVKKISDATYYLASTGDGLEVVPGDQLEGRTPAAEVVFMCRPPQRADLDAAQGSLLQV